MYAIITRDIYDLCEIESGGFCAAVCSNEIKLTNYIIVIVFSQLQNHQNILMLLNNVLVLEIRFLQMILVWITILPWVYVLQLLQLTILQMPFVPIIHVTIV